jgi:hypothetical protein
MACPGRRHWDEFGVIGEVDGKQKYAEDSGIAANAANPLWRETQRQQRLEQTGLIVVRWGRAALDGPTRVAERLHSAFRRGTRLPVDDRHWIARPTRCM